MAVAFGQLSSKAAGIRAVRVGAVQQDDIGLSDGVQLGKDAALRLQISLPRQVGNRAVRCDNEPDRGMLPDDAACAGLGCQIERHLVVEPGAFDKARRFVFLMAQRAVHHVAHTVDEPCPEAAAARKLDPNRLLGDKLRFGGHDGAPGSGLGQLIMGTGPACFVFDAGQQHKLCKALDEGAFAAAHRPHNTEVDVPAGALGYVLVDLFLCHGCTLLYSAAGISRQAASVVSS